MRRSTLLLVFLAGAFLSAAFPSVALAARAMPTTDSIVEPAPGPHLLYMQQGKDWRLVCDVEREQPYVLINGKPELGDGGLRDVIEPTTASNRGNGYLLKEAQMFFPALVKVENVNIRITSQQVDRINKLTKGLSFSAGFSTSTPLKRVYAAVEVTAKSGNRRYYLHAVDDLVPNHTKFLSFDQVFPTGFDPETTRFYLFSGGVELLHSELPAAVIADGEDKLVAYQLEKRPAPAPQPLIAPPPIYPAELRSKNTAGKVVVTLRVTSKGKVENPKVTESSDPAFTQATLAALAQWRFVPAVKDGKPVATAISLPFAFAP